MGNAQLIRDAYEALNRGDPRPFLDLYDPDIELFAPSWSGLETGVFRGADVVERYYGHAFAQWAGMRYELSEVVEWGRHVSVFARWAAQGKRSEIPAHGEFISVFSFDDGRIVSIAQLGGAASR